MDYHRIVGSTAESPSTALASYTKLHVNFQEPATLNYVWQLNARGVLLFKMLKDVLNSLARELKDSCHDYANCNPQWGLQLAFTLKKHSGNICIW